MSMHIQSEQKVLSFTHASTCSHKHTPFFTSAAKGWNWKLELSQGSDPTIKRPDIQVTHYTCGNANVFLCYFSDKEKQKLGCF